MTYDNWKTTNPADEFLGPEPPPCERSFAGHIHDHPRFPSGDCMICGALCTEACKHDLFAAWEADDEQLRYETETGNA